MERVQTTDQEIWTSDGLLSTPAIEAARKRDRIEPAARPGLFLHDAEYRTASWRRRHSPEARARLGAWRWKGIQRHAPLILSLLDGCPDEGVIDLGGADGPLGFGSVVVDSKEGSPYNTLDEVPEPCGLIFSSHMLEHVADLDSMLLAICEKLSSWGSLVLHVPSWTCTRWRADEYDNPAQSELHRHTFALIADEPPRIGALCYLDAKVALALDVRCAEHCGDDSIIIFASKK